ncbi:MAG: hypothetical protein JJE04_13625 [Acidobacteriia bacterium]|nr:hypothetical protein [Terriglobia bacterium]
MNLVMIGRFTDAGAAASAKEIIDKLTEHVRDESQAGEIEIGGHHIDRFSERMLNLLRELEIYDVSPVELEQFGYDFDVKVDGDKVVLTTDESDVSAFLKVLIDKGARVEVYSAHNYPDTAHGR